MARLARVANRHAAPPGRGLEHGLPFGAKGGEQGAEQAEVHVAHNVGMRPGDGVERAVAQAQDAGLILVRLVATLAQQPVEVRRLGYRSGDLLTERFGGLSQCQTRLARIVRSGAGQKLRSNAVVARGHADSHLAARAPIELGRPPRARARATGPARVGDGQQAGVGKSIEVVRGERPPDSQSTVAGLERRARRGEPLADITSVASFFVSRVDAKVDALLPPGSDLRGRVAVANARLGDARCRARFAGPRWQGLSCAGARPQRPLWASTGTKDPAYSDVLYVEALIARDVNNTMPQATLDAFADHGDAGRAFDPGSRHRWRRFAAPRRRGSTCLP